MAEGTVSYRRASPSDAAALASIAELAQGRYLALMDRRSAPMTARPAGSVEPNHPLPGDEVMTENLELYCRIGYVELERAEQDGYRRVLLTKQLF